MPYEWHDQIDSDGLPVRRLILWRYRSLTPAGFAWAIGGAATALVLPLLAVVGSAVLWGLLPFAAGAVWALWYAMQYAWRHGGTVEQLTLRPDLLHVTRRDPGRAPRDWQGNPYWVRLALRDQPVEAYLTLTDGGGREIELGAFLTPDERRQLRADLQDALAAVRDPRAG